MIRRRLFKIVVDNNNSPLLQEAFSIFDSMNFYIYKKKIQAHDSCISLLRKIIQPPKANKHSLPINAKEAVPAIKKKKSI